MILDRIRGGRFDSGLLPAEKFHAPTVSVIGIMTFAMMVVAAAGLALSNAAGLVVQASANRYVVELPAGAAGQLPRALSAARSNGAVIEATPVPENEMRRTLERWIGEGAASPDLPVPALITLKLAAGADTAAIGAKIRDAVPAARLIAESGELKPLLRSIRSLQWLALALVLLMSVAAGAAVVLASRGALDTHRPTIDIMHGIGATDRQLTRLFERKIALDALAGAALGAVAAAAVVLLVIGSAPAFAGDFGAGAPLDLFDGLILALVPLAVIGLATLVARWTLLRALRAAL
ncbi:MAG TPA: FtsX-like permease family protein [Sphingomicrobium sp.]|nr:FtsX-like permease family protein [Sphingomicrobium sp.]